MSKHEVLLLENIHPAAWEVFERNDFVVHTRSGSLGEDELIEALQGMSMVGIRSNTKVTERVLESAPDLLAIGAFCIGTNQIDLDAAVGANGAGRASSSSGGLRPVSAQSRKDRSWPPAGAAPEPGVQAVSGPGATAT